MCNVCLLVVQWAAEAVRVHMRTVSLCFVGWSLPQMAAAANLASFAGCTGTDCSACNMVSLANGFIGWLIGFLFIIFAVVTAVAGFGLVTSGGNRRALDAAKGRFANALIGLAIVLAGWLIVDTLMRAIVGQTGHEGELNTMSGWLFWGEVQCQVQTEAGYTELTLADLATEQEALTSGCQHIGVSVESLQAIGCQFTPCTTTSCLTACSNIVEGGAVGQPAGNYCAVAGTGTSVGTPATPVGRDGMVSLSDAGLQVANWSGITGPGRTDLAHPQAVAAAQRMQTLAEQRYGRRIFQITAAFTEGVGHSSGSQHYRGVAIDFDPINGGTNAQVAALAEEAGFTFVLDEGTHVHGDMR